MEGSEGTGLSWHVAMTSSIPQTTHGQHASLPVSCKVQSTSAEIHTSHSTLCLAERL